MPASPPMLPAWGRLGNRRLWGQRGQDRGGPYPPCCLQQSACLGRRDVTRQAQRQGLNLLWQRAGRALPEEEGG